MSEKNQPTLASITQSILNDCFVSVIHELVLQVHASETALAKTADPKTGLPICPSCNLPRLLDPPLASSRPDKSTQYCSHVPWSRKPGHDIYGNPFPIAGSDKPPTKKEREARAAQAAASSKKKDGTPGKNNSNNGKGGANNSDDDGDAPNIAGGPVDKKAAKVGERLKGGTYVPWHTCPSCKRSLLITRFAQHLEKCLGIGGRGRAAARNNNGNAAAGNNSQGSGTGAGNSRGGTPTGKDRAAAAAARDDSDEDDDIKGGDAAMRKKVLKKGLKKEVGKASGTRDGLKVSKMLSGAKNEGDGGGGADGEGVKNKRDRDEEEEDVTPIRKKLKLQRTHSLVSNASMSVDHEGSVLGDESVDGSFVNNEEDEASEED